MGSRDNLMRKKKCTVTFRGEADQIISYPYVNASSKLLEEVVYVFLSIPEREHPHWVSAS